MNARAVRLRVSNRGRPPFARSEPRASCRAAFTLLEVLVALAIFALGAVVLGSAYLNVLNSYEAVSRGRQVSEDFAFARHLVLTEPDRLKLEQGGEFETANGRRARWTVEIESTTLADLFKVAFTCEIPDPTRIEPDKQVQTFVLLRPTWSIDAMERSKLKEETKTRILELQGKLRQQ
jgi:general secretion pathway protein I